MAAGRRGDEARMFGIGIPELLIILVVLVMLVAVGAIMLGVVLGRFRR